MSGEFDGVQWYRDQWEASQSVLGGQHLAWLSELRQQQLTDFLAQGFPTVRDENWKYTDVSRFAKQSWVLPDCVQQEPSEPLMEQVKALSLTTPHHRLVFIDGYYSAHLSCLQALPPGVILTNLATACVENESLLRTYLTAEQSAKTAFFQLNSAFMTDGAFLYLPPNCTLELPIHLLYLTSPASSHSESLRMMPVRNVITVADNARAVVYEDYQSSTGIYFTNVVTQVFIENGSRLHFCKVQNESPQASHVAQLAFFQQQDSCLVAQSCSLGGDLAREDWHCSLQKPGAQASFHGFYLPIQQQQMDCYLHIDHLTAKGTSEVLYKGVIMGKSKAAFRGKVLVQQDAQQTSAHLYNQNLLLARSAEVNTKPELEIYADDVTCQHGATVGQIDEEMLFYLRSRGIPLDKAYQLLVFAFMNEILEKIPADFAAQIHDIVVRRLAENYQV
jgi:Fe-S cluster assembly protein SufD